ncbi:MAG: PaaI family thioesterase [Saccharofermentans sp.]|nr:PaaI family thioesterase [Saccharofermentans sp.]
MTPEECRSFFANDRYANDATEIEILEVKEGYAKTKLVVQDKHLNANNVVMGGCIYTLADYTFGIASNCGPSKCVTLNSGITFNSAATGKELYAETEVVKDGRSISNYLVRVTDEKGRVIATSTMVGFRS